MNLDIVGFESGLSGPSDDPDSDWLVVSAVVGDDRGTRTYSRLSLEVGEVRALGTWMRAVANGDITPAPAGDESRALMHFVEPGLAVALLSHDGALLATCWYFYDADDPDADSAATLIDYPVYSIVVATSGAEIASAADSWLQELNQLLQRG